jgi:hypothetical protein
MKRSIQFPIILLSLSFNLRSQNIPPTIKTEYLQIFIGGRNGTSTTGDVSKGCVIFFIDSGANIIEKDCESAKVLSSIKIVTSEPTKFFSNGWSKRLIGYDPNSPSYSPDGTIILTDFYTITLKDSRYEVFTELVSGDVSLATRFFNL